MINSMLSFKTIEPSTQIDLLMNPKKYSNFPKQVLDDEVDNAVSDFWKELKELGRKGIVSPKTGKKINLASEEFWYKYFEIANSEGHKKWIRSFKKI